MESIISKSLIKLRKSKNLTQMQFGKLLGMSRSKVSSWEVGRRDLSIIDAIIISDYFQVSLDTLLNPKSITSEKVINYLECYRGNTYISEEEKKETFEKVTELINEKDLLICT